MHDYPCGRRSAVKLSVFLAGLLAAASSAFASITANFTPSRTTGVAPLAVNFDTTAQPDGTPGTTSTATTRPFHDCYYSWNYGDANAGVWATNGKSKNHDTGPIGGHVYETPGTYTVTLLVKDTTGTTVTKTATITVTDPNVVFSGVNTICVSRTTDFTGAPTGAQLTTSTSWTTIKNLLGTGKRVLLHRGQAWDHDNAERQLKFAGPGILGAFGSGANPILDIKTAESTGGGRVFLLGDSFNPNQFGDFRFMDLEIRGNNIDRGFAHVNATVHDLLFLRVNMHDAGRFFEFGGSTLLYYNDPSHGSDYRPGQTMYTGIHVVDTQYNHIIGDGAEFNGHFIAFIASVHSIFMGNTWNDSHLGEHVLRLPYSQRELIAHNRLSNCRDAKHVIKLHAAHPAGTDFTGVEPTDPWGLDSKFIVISDNYIANNLSDWYVAVGPQNSTENELVTDVILERNEVVQLAGTTGWEAFDIRADEVTIRNNAFVMTGASSGTAVYLGWRGGEPFHKNNRIYNNSAFQGSTGGFTFVNIQNSVSGTIFKNNLAKSTGGSPVLIAGTGAVTQSNNSLTSTPGWVASAPATALDFDLLSTSSAIGAGTSLPVFDDYEEAPRPQSTTWDQGAFEFISSTPVVTIAATDASAGEPSNNGQFTITAIPAPTSAITVNLSITGTATNGTDYTTIPTTVTVGTSGSATINVTVIDDAVVESSETVILTAIAGTGYTVGSPASATVTIIDNDTANSVPTITTTSLPNGTAGTAYSQTLTATGGDGALVWSLVSGTLPAGLSLSSGGVISGTPTFGANASIAVRVADSDGITGPSDEDVKAFNLTIDPAAGATKFTVAGGAVTASANDGNVPANTVDGNLATRWSAQGDGQWIQYDLGGTSTISYIKIAWYVGDTRTANFDVQVSDSATGPWTNALTAQDSTGTTTALETYDFADVNARYVRILGHGNTDSTWNSITEVEVWGAFVNSVPSIVTTSLPNGTAGAAYSQTLAGSGGNGPLIWSVDSGALPAGLSLSSTGVISGTPTVGGTSVFTVRVADSDAVTGPTDEATQALTLIIDPAAGATKFTIPAASVTASADDGNIPSNTVDGNLATRWSALGDPQWIQYDLGSTNTVNYVKIAWYQGDTRTSTFDVQVATVSTGPWTNVLTNKVSSGTTAGLEVFDFTDVVARYVRINGHGNSSGNGWNSISETEVWGIANSVPNITTTTLPNGIVGSAYSQTLAATGGNGALVWSIASGTLPAGLVLSSGGVISGTPTTSGTSSFTVRVADSDGITGAADEDTQALSITIGGLPSPWVQADIGAVGAAGTATYSSGTFSIDGSGVGIGNSADEFHYVYQTASGDCSITAKVLSVENTNASAKAGVMIRETLGDTSKHASVIINPSNNAVFVRRSSTGGTTSTTTQGAGIPYWVRVTRVGDTFTAYRSSDGTTWTNIQSVTITMGTSVYIGLAVTSTNDGTLCTSTMSNVTASP